MRGSSENVSKCTCQGSDEITNNNNFEIRKITQWGKRDINFYVPEQFQENQ